LDSDSGSTAMVGALAVWSRMAGAGQQYLYHVGNLARDRRASVILNSVADTALLLCETRFLRLQQQRQAYAREDEDRYVYIAVRSGTGYAPLSVTSLRISSFEWRALRAVRDREAGISATRAIRDALVASSPTSLDVARSMIELLQQRQLIQAASGKGWELSPAGLEALT
jgi:hypothetical protein